MHMTRVYGYIGAACWVQPESVAKAMREAINHSFDADPKAWRRIYPRDVSPDNRDAVAYIARAAFGM
jgi:hypothetical protein